MTMKVSVEAGGAGKGAFDRMFDKAIDRWSREEASRATREARTADDRAIGGRKRS